MTKKEFRHENEYRYNRKNPVLWIMSHMARYPVLPFIPVVLSLLNNYAYGNIQLFIGRAFSVLEQPDWKPAALAAAAAVIAGSALVQGLTGLGRNFTFEFLAQKIEQNAREELYLSLLGKSQSFHGRQRIGDIMSRATTDVKSLNYMLNPGLLLIIDSGLALVIPAVMIFFISPALLPVPLIFTVFLVITVAAYNKKLNPVSFAQREQQGRINSGLAEALEGIELVKLSVQENYEFRRFSSDVRLFRDYFIKQGLIQAKYYPMLVFALCWGLAFFHGLFLWENARLELGAFISFMGLFSTFRFTTFISIFSFNLVQSGLASAKRILEIINDETELDENSTGCRKKITGNIEFLSVCLNFSGRKVLDGINFTLQAGETAAVAGRTGSGKSTLTRLINRIYDPDCGEIFLDGVNIKDWSMESLRSQIAVIEQDVFLFSGTIRENIAFSRPEASESDILKAAAAAQALNFINDFKDGLDTVIGEKGVNLSGGQKQRVALARAFLAEPAVLILDDSTSAVDSATEDEIRRAVQEVSRGRTSVIITHRLSQIRRADKIILLENGRVIACGRHDELFSSCPEYSALFSGL